MFFFEIPAEALPDAEPSNLPAAARPQRRFQGRVLVVEDNRINRRVAERLLEQLGCTVECVNDGGAAVAAVAGGAYDLVLMDCQMPTMDGYEATAKIRELAGVTGATPIVALTASASTESAQRCLDAGMNAFLAKPLDGARVEQVLAEWLFVVSSRST